MFINLLSIINLMSYKDPIKYKNHQKDYRIKNRHILLPKHRIACHNHYIKNKDKINAEKKIYRKEQFRH